jgi:hypothetical protein
MTLLPVVMRNKEYTIERKCTNLRRIAMLFEGSPKWTHHEEQRIIYKERPVGCDIKKRP